VDNFYVRMFNGPEVYGLPVGAIDSTHLEKAKAMLDKFDVVLILEKFNLQGPPLLKHNFAWHQPSVSTKRTSRPPLSGRFKMTDNLKDLFQARNTHDLELYKYAQERCMRDYTRCQELDPDSCPPV
jgi:hypothetical protein